MGTICWFLCAANLEDAGGVQRRGAERVERRVHRRAAGHPHARSRFDANVAAISIVRQAADTFMTGRSADVERQVAWVLYLQRGAHSSRSGSCREDREEEMSSVSLTSWIQRTALRSWGMQFRRA